MWFGLLPVRSPLLGESLLICFPELLRWFTSLSIAPVSYIFRYSGDALLHRITPFGNPGVNGYVLLTPAYRSLSRPSSPGSSIGIRHRPVFAWPYHLFRSFTITGTFVCITFSNQAVIQSLAQKLLLFSMMRLKIFPHHFPSFLRNFKELVIPNSFRDLLIDAETSSA